MNDSSPPPARRSRRRGCLIALLLLLLAGAYGILAVLARRELASAVADSERTDPRWRLEDVEADRADIPESRNAALTVMAIKPLMPAKWPIWDLARQVNDPKIEAQRVALQTSFAELEPQRQLNKEQIDALRAELDRASRALDKARTLADKPEGRYPIAYSEDWIGTRLPCLQNTREVGTLLAHDVLLLAQEKHCDQALGSCRAILNAGRSIGDEPMFISQLVRYALRAIAVGRLQRTLAQGESSDAALAQVQQLLEKEEPEPLLLSAARGERAGFDRFLESLEAHKGSLFGGEPENFGQKDRPIEFLLLRVPAVRTSQRAAMLRYMTRLVEIARLPPEQLLPEVEKLDASIRTQPLLVRLLCPAMSKIAAADIRGRMDLRCAIAAVAAERYRQKQNKWPDSLEALRDAGHLKEVPMDLYNGQSVRLKRSEDGLLIYSVGPDGEDNGGHIDPVDPIAKGSDRVFRLWDVSKRRQDAKPLKVAPPMEEGPGIPPGLPPGG